MQAKTYILDVINCLTALHFRLVCAFVIFINFSVFFKTFM